MPPLSQDSAGFTASQQTGPSPPRLHEHLFFAAPTPQSRGRAKKAGAAITAAAANAASSEAKAAKPKPVSVTAAAEAVGATTSPLIRASSIKSPPPPAPPPPPAAAAVRAPTLVSSPPPAASAAAATHKSDSEPVFKTPAAKPPPNRPSPIPVPAPPPSRVNEQPAAFSPVVATPATAGAAGAAGSSGDASGSASGSGSGSGSSMDDVRCSVCWSGDCEDDNKIVGCDGCGVWVHQSCYGIVVVPKGKWFCDPCDPERTGAAAAAAGNKPPTADLKCTVCDNSDDRAYKPLAKSKPTDPDRWIHASCAMWHTGPEFVNAKTFSPVKSADQIDPARFRLKCQFCKKRGACLQCTFPRCFISYHVPCGRRNGIRFELFDGPESDVYFHTFCHQHQTQADCDRVRKNNSTASTHATGSGGTGGGGAGTRGKRRGAKKSSGNGGGRRGKKKWEMEEDENVHADDDDSNDDDTDPFEDDGTRDQEEAMIALATAESAAAHAAAIGGSTSGSASKNKRRRTTTPPPPSTTHAAGDEFDFKGTAPRSAPTSKRAKPSGSDSLGTSPAPVASTASSPAPAAAAKRSFVVLPTKLDDAQTDVLRHTVKACGGRLTYNWTSEVTHVVTHARNSAKHILPARTLKYFLALLGGQAIVTYDCKYCKLACTLLTCTLHHLICIGMRVSRVCRDIGLTKGKSLVSRIRVLRERRYESGGRTATCKRSGRSARWNQFEPIRSVTGRLVICIEQWIGFKHGK